MNPLIPSGETNYDIFMRRNRNVVLPPPPFVILSESLYRNDTEFPTRPGMLLSPAKSFTIPVCAKLEKIVKLINNSLRDLQHLRFEYYSEQKYWFFVFGYPVVRMNYHEKSIYEAAIVAYNKFPANFDDDDRNRIEKYMYAVGNLNDTMFPYCKGTISLFYDVIKKNVIVEIHKNHCDHGSNYGRDFIFDRVRHAITLANIEVSPYEYNDNEKKFKK